MGNFMYTYMKHVYIKGGMGNSKQTVQRNYKTGKNCKTIFEAALQCEIKSQFSRLHPPSFLDFGTTANYNVLLHTSKILEVLPTTKTKRKQTMPQINIQKKTPTNKKSQNIKKPHTQ